MKFLTKYIQILTNITRYIALITMISMVVFITFAVISRALFTPIIGDVEIVQLGMVVLIMCGLAYTEQIKGHIAIGLIVDKLSNKTQRIMDIFSSLLTVAVTLVIGMIYIEVTLNHKNHMQLSTTLLEVPYYLFDIIIVIGFVMWGLEALLNLINLILGTSPKTQTKEGDAI